MTVKGMKKTLNLHKYSVRVNSLMPNRKIIIPAIFVFAGITAGCINGKGEGTAYHKIIDIFISLVLNKEAGTLFSETVKYVMFPSVFAALIFFSGLCAYGMLTSNFFPFAFSYLTGIISYYMYNTYMLKGLAYCVIMIFPYAVLCTAGIMFCTAESMNMSEIILQNLTGRIKNNDYSFKIYCKKFLINYIVIAAGAIIKLLLGRLFSGLFLF